MSYREETFGDITMYSIVCDDCGDVYDNGDGELYEDTGELLECVYSEGWQEIDNNHSKTLHYCSRHLRAVCSKCGRHEIASIKTLYRKEWFDVQDREETMCPECVKKYGWEVK